MNDDLISRQAAIDAIERTDWYHINNKGELVHGANSKDDVPLYKAEDIYKAVNDLPSAQQWTPCSERLPENEDLYMVMLNTSNLYDNEKQVTDAYWINNQWQYGVLESYEHRMPKLVIEPIEELKVIAWMPFPEPYKGEES